MKLVLQPSVEDYRIAQLAVLAIGIHVLESALPSPIPGIKPGLANVITIAVFFLYGVRAAIWVSLLRVVVGSIAIGTFLTPTFMMSLGGALASITVLFLIWQLRVLNFGPVGVALLASLGHMLGQFLLAYSLFLPHPSLWNLFPVFMTAALIFGLVSGVITQQLLYRMQS